MFIRETAEQIQTHLQEQTTWVREVLEPGQLSTTKHAQRLGRLTLRPRTVVILWALRIYVVVMSFLILYQIWLALHP